MAEAVTRPGRSKGNTRGPRKGAGRNQGAGAIDVADRTAQGFATNSAAGISTGLIRRPLGPAPGSTSIQERLRTPSLGPGGMQNRWYRDVPEPSLRLMPAVRDQGIADTRDSGVRRPSISGLQTVSHEPDHVPELEDPGRAGTQSAIDSERAKAAQEALVDIENLGPQLSPFRNIEEIRNMLTGGRAEELAEGYLTAERPAPALWEGDDGVTRELIWGRDVMGLDGWGAVMPSVREGFEGVLVFTLAPEELQQEANEAANAQAQHDRDRVFAQQFYAARDATAQDAVISGYLRSLGFAADITAAKSQQEWQEGENRRYEDFQNTQRIEKQEFETNFAQTQEEGLIRLRKKLDELEKTKVDANRVLDEEVAAGQRADQAEIDKERDKILEKYRKDATEAQYTHDKLMAWFRRQHDDKQRKEAEKFEKEEREGAEAFRTTEREEEQTFRTLEREDSESFQRLERQFSERFQAAQSLLERDWRFSQNALDRDLQTLIFETQEGIRLGDFETARQRREQQVALQSAQFALSVIQTMSASPESILAMRTSGFLGLVESATGLTFPSLAAPANVESALANVDLPTLRDFERMPFDQRERILTNIAATVGIRKEVIAAEIARRAQGGGLGTGQAGLQRIPIGA
jgi:hypothetical protein